MKSFILVGLLLSCAANAQEGRLTQSGYSASAITEPIGDEGKPKWSWATATKIVKVNPFELMSAIPTIGADFEMKMPHPVLSLQMGAGFSPDYLQFFAGDSENQFKQMNGYNIRFEPRFFIFTGKHHYISSEFYFRHFIIKDEVPVGMEGAVDEWGQTGNFAYFVNTDMLFHRFNARLTLKYGIQHVFRNGFAMEFYTGISARKTNVISNSPIPEGGVPQGRWNALEWNLEDGHMMHYITPVFGMKLGLAIKR